MDNAVNHIIKNNIPCFFISPHLDDAALSAGGLIRLLSEKTDVTIITVFTAARSSSYTLSAKKAISDGKYNNAAQFYKARREEDIKAFEDLNVQLMHLNEEESLYRLKPKPNSLEKALANLLPEFIHVYPTYKFHIAKGDISPHDETLIKRIADKLKAIIPDGSVVFAPYGIGKHIDHLVVREAVETVFTPISWLDQPYLEREKGKTPIPDGFSLIACDQKKKKKMLASYTSQIPLLFSGPTPDLPEYFRFSR